MKRNIIQRSATGLLVMLALSACRDEQKLKAEQDALVNHALDNMVMVKGGRFLMGDFGPLVGEKLPYSPAPDTKPLHAVELSDYRIGKYRVTWGEFNRWRAIQGWKNNDYYQQIINSKDPDIKSFKIMLGDNYPASATWDDARAWCQWLGQVSQRNIDLPSEAQWEYAARSRGQLLIFGNSDNRYYYEDDNARNFAPSMYHKPVGSYAPNPLGLYDIMRNGTDWIKDNYAADYYHHSPEKDPPGPDSGDKKVVRGMPLDAGEGYTITRANRKPDWVFSATGFRCAENSPLK